ncbi:helix-turn-helix transcriptional regulator [Streptomyces sp. NPDC012746]|uniref:helix-turn-helix transcriptional regulator n=1 Tax=Streptomyces sp. NPDC012746 TaxID=3364845 RepID=UPI00369415F6
MRSDHQPLECRRGLTTRRGAWRVRIRRERLRELRRTRGLTQSQMAAVLGCSRSAVSTWETKGQMPLPDRLHSLAKFLGVPFSELVEDEGSVTLRTLRRRAGMLQREVAAHLAVGIPTYCDVERQRQGMPDRWVPVLSTVFGVPADILRSLSRRQASQHDGGGAGN